MPTPYRDAGSREEGGALLHHPPSNQLSADMTDDERGRASILTTEITPPLVDLAGLPAAISNTDAVSVSDNALAPEALDADVYGQLDVDTDTDMEDGGAPLAMTLSHAERLNVEMDILDMDIMGEHNLANLHNSPTESLLLGMDFQPLDHGPFHTDGVPAAVMTEVYQQPEHIQDGVDHGEPHLDDTLIIDASMLPNSASSLSSLLSAAAGHEMLWLPSPAFPALEEPGETQNWVAYGTSPELDWENVFSSQDLPLFIASDSTDWSYDGGSDADHAEVEDSLNLGFGDFLTHWASNAERVRRDDQLVFKKHRHRGPKIQEVYKQRYIPLDNIQRSDLQGELCDIQRINWKDLGVSRLEAKAMRRKTYKNYANLRPNQMLHPRLTGIQLEDEENYFKFRRMDFSHKVHLTHFQLRNLLACPSKDRIFYAGLTKIFHHNPARSADATPIVMDLSEPTVEAPFQHFDTPGIQITTMTSAHDVLIAGGFSGEYAMINLGADKHTRHTEGMITDHQNSISNHVQIHLSPSSSLPQATFASNDQGVRILDINTNKFIAEHKYDHAINCTAISPDQRLRVLVGDDKNVKICNAETGEILQDLEGHRDFGFACDWADDGWAVATGNQDMQVKIWDARKWTNSSGHARPVATISAEMAGVRKLKFSPLGSGKRVLAAAEPADIVSLIDGELFASKQTLSFFGEIGGIDFTNEGRDLIVANCDSMRGGIMEFERCDLPGGLLYTSPKETNSGLDRGHTRTRGYHGFGKSTHAYDNAGALGSIPFF